MIINSEITKKLINIQKEKSKEQNYYNDNKFILFYFALLNNKSTVISVMIEELSFKIEEIREYIDTLLKYDLIKEEDLKLLKKIEKVKPKITYELEMQEIIKHLNTITNRNLTLNETREKRLKSLLSSGKYTINDFKSVNLYYMKLWGSDSKMKGYLTPDTLYNTKFDSRLEASKEFFNTFKKHELSIKKMCDKFHKLFEMEIYPKHKLLAQEIQLIDDIYKEIPMDLQATIVHWLEFGYTVEEIINTIEVTIESWSKKEEFKAHISISKILDSKFPDRLKVAKKLIEKINKPALKESQHKINDWLERKQNK